MSTILEWVVLWLALVGGMLGFSRSASADWQGTVWGMSLEAADKSFSVPHRRAAPWQGDSGKLDFDDYTTGNIDFVRGYLEFKDDKLIDLGMYLRYAMECDSLFDTFKSLYGKPESDRKKPNVSSYDPQGYIRRAIWVDQSHNNKILLQYSTSRSCQIMYMPLKSPPGLAPPAVVPFEPSDIKLTPAPGGL